MDYVAISVAIITAIINIISIWSAISQNKKSIKYQLILNLHSQWMALGYQSSVTGASAQYIAQMNALLSQIKLINSSFAAAVNNCAQSYNTYTNTYGPTQLSAIDNLLTQELQEIIK